VSEIVTAVVLRAQTLITNQKLGHSDLLCWIYRSP